MPKIFSSFWEIAIREGGKTMVTEEHRMLLHLRERVPLIRGNLTMEDVRSPAAVEVWSRKHYCYNNIPCPMYETHMLYSYELERQTIMAVCSVGDGDCGATVKRGAAAIQDALKEGLPLNDAAPLCHCLTRSVNAMGGTSGAIYNIFFAAAAGRICFF